MREAVPIGSPQGSASGRGQGDAWARDRHRTSPTPSAACFVFRGRRANRLESLLPNRARVSIVA